MTDPSNYGLYSTDDIGMFENVQASFTNPEYFTDDMVLDAFDAAEALQAYILDGYDENGVHNNTFRGFVLGLDILLSGIREAAESRGLIESDDGDEDDQDDEPPAPTTPPPSSNRPTIADVMRERANYRKSKG